MNNIIQNEEILARYIYKKHWLRKNNTVKPDAFMPYGNPLEVSVTCHDDLSENDLWEVGKKIVDYINENNKEVTKYLYGRADIVTKDIRSFQLTVKPDPDLILPNPNHAVIENWQQIKNKAECKQIALDIAKLSNFTPVPIS